VLSGPGPKRTGLHRAWVVHLAISTHGGGLAGQLAVHNWAAVVVGISVGELRHLQASEGVRGITVQSARGIWLCCACVVVALCRQGGG
jgi:hypothetical protein